jgi:hypothetical protein
LEWDVVDYWHYLLPRPATFKPEPQVLANLTDLWSREGWVPAGFKGSADRLRAYHITNLGPHGELPRPEDRQYGPADYHHGRKIKDEFEASVTLPLSAAWFVEKMANEIATVELNRFITFRAKTNRLYVNQSISELNLGFEFELEQQECHARFAARQWSHVGGKWNLVEHKIEGEPRIPFGPFDFTQGSYTLSMEIAADFVYRTFETIDRFGEQDTICRQCRQQLCYSHLYDPRVTDERIYANCPHCGTPFDPSNLFAAGRDGWTGARRHYQGGATSRFAIVIGNHVPEEADLVVDPTFHHQCEEVLGCRLIEVPCWNP